MNLEGCSEMEGVDDWLSIGTLSTLSPAATAAVAFVVVVVVGGGNFPPGVTQTVGFTVGLGGFVPSVHSSHF